MSQFYVNDITKQIIKNTIPKIKVVLLIISSLPLSFLFLNKSPAPPVIIWDAPSALPLWSKTSAIITIHKMINP